MTRCTTLQESDCDDHDWTGLYPVAGEGYTRWLCLDCGAETHEDPT